MSYPRKASKGGHPTLVAITWLLTGEYFLAQVVSAWAWPSDYSWIHNSISDLGVSTCSAGTGDVMCSPLSVFFNLSLIGVGLAISSGAVLAHLHTRAGWLELTAFGCLTVAGLGTAMLGIFPSDTVDFAHHLGAILALFGSTAGITIMSGTRLPISLPIRLYTIVCAVVALVGFVLVGLYFVFGIGVKGLAERTSSYPVILWLMVFGVHLSTTEPSTRGARMASGGAGVLRWNHGSQERA